MSRLAHTAYALLACLLTTAEMRADTYATSVIGGYPWTDGVHSWGLAEDCYPHNGNGFCGDGRWFVTLEHGINQNADITLTGLSTGPTGGSLNGGAVTMTVEEVFNWPAGNMSLAGGTVHLLPGCVSSIEGGFNGATLLNQGTMLQTNFIRNQGTVINDVGAEWEINLPSDGYFIWDGAGSFINHGLLRKTGPASTHPHSIDTFHITGTGELRIEEGQFSITDSSSTGLNLLLDGQLEVFAGAVAVIGRPITFDPAAKVGGGGTVRFQTHPDTTTVQGTWDVAGLTEIKSGNVDFISPCVTNDFSQCYGTLTGDVTINGLGVWSDGIMASPGTTWVNGDMTIDTAISCGFAAPMALYNRTLQLAPGSQLLVVSGGPLGQNGAVIDVPAGASMFFDTPTSFRAMGADPAGGTIENDGVIEKSGPGDLWLGWAVNSRGLVNVAEGHLDLQSNPFTQTDGELRLNGTSISAVWPAVIDLQGGKLTGDGTISGSVNGYDVFFNSATIAPGAPGAAGLFDFTTTCNVRLQAGSILEFDIGGTVPGIEHDAITPYSFLELNGALHLAFIDGFEDVVSDTDVIVLAELTTGSVTGAFTNVASGGDLETADGKGVFTIHYGAGSPFDPQKVVATNFRAFCRADFNGDGAVTIEDLLALLAAWGPCPGCPEDIDGDGDVGILDLLDLLAAWGACP